MTKHSFLRFVLFSLLVFSNTFSFSQAEAFRNYTVEDGLPQSEVHHLIQDKGGYLWAATDAGGICRYDGKTFTAYTTLDGLADNKTFFLCESPNGNIWVGTNKGISIFNGQTFLPLPAELEKLKKFGIGSIEFDAKGNAWIAADNGLFCWNGKTCEKNESIPGNVKSIFKDGLNQLWIGTIANGIYRISGPSIKNYTSKNGLRSNVVWTITEPVKGTLWIGTDAGISQFNLSNDSIRNFPNQNAQNIRSIVADKNKSIWVITDGNGIYQYTGENFKHITTKQGLACDVLWHGLKDREGNIWIGTHGYGIIKDPFFPFTSLSDKDGLPGNQVFSILHDSKGREWYGTDLGATEIITDKATGEKKAVSFIGINSKYPAERIWTIIEDKQGNIWFSTYRNGVYKYDGTTLKNYTKKDGLTGDYVRSLKCDDEGNIWMGAVSGLNKFDGKKFENFSMANGMPHKVAITIFKDSKGGMWFATNGGLCKYDPAGDEQHKFISFTEKEGLPSNPLLGLTEDSEGNIWCGGFEGISKINFEKKTCTNITVKEGLTSNSVYLMIADKRGNLFVGTNKGIDKINTIEYNKTGKVELKHFGKEEGFSGLECNTNSCFREEGSAIWFGSVFGAIRFDPERDQKNLVEPLLHIRDINLFFEKFDWTKFALGTDTATALPLNLNLPYNKNHLTFNCIALSLTIPEKTVYSFKMEGFDQSWSPATKQPYITYSYLPPGKYTFMVKAMNNDGVWTTSPATFSFTIVPPFWQTWWFYLFTGSALIISVFLFVKGRLRALRKRAIELQDKIDEKTAELRLEKERVELQSKIIEKKNQNITASINYAKRIQNTVLPIKENIQKLFPDSFILLLPKDIVSGDFYWFAELGNKIVVAAVDCTGHGIPGAFMSLIGNNLLEQVVTRSEILNPSEILYRLHEEIIISLKKNEKNSGTVDGMDISICVVEKQTMKLEFASSGQPMILIKNGVAERIKSGKYPLGLILKKERLYETQTFTLNKGDAFYLFTDGFLDQFGELIDEKFGEERLKCLLIELCNKDVEVQQTQLQQTFETWKGNNPQMDDILIIGVRI
jgi:ligand-binding sensor domain-containing protein/serine phosphatase RsbU (regulator of sigma subunit)